MKHLKILAFICILALISTDSFGRKKYHKSNYSKPKKEKTYKGGDGGDQNPVGAPLDGGLLTILGAAGVAYYVSRKKKKNSLTP